MPPKKTKQAVAQMEAKIDALENELAEMRTSLMVVTLAVKDLPSSLAFMMEKSMGKKIPDEGESGNRNSEDPFRGRTPEVTGDKGGPSRQPTLQGDALNEFRHSVKKVELPIFDGKDPAGWISRAEVYFRVQETSPEVKVSLAQLSMEGTTIHFYNSLLEAEEDLTWEKLRDALLERYGGHGDGDVYKQLTELRQTGYVEEYITEFEYLTAQIPKLPDKQFQGYFVHGLKEEIRGIVRSLAAMGGVSRSKLLVVARAVEKEVKGDSGSGFARGNRYGGGAGKTGGSGFGSGSGRSGTDWVWVRGNKDSGTQKTKRFVFKCGGPFHPMHHCPDKNLRVLILEDDDGELEEGNILALEVGEGDDELEGELSLMCLKNLVGGGEKEQPRTMKLLAMVNGVPVIILVDSGASHNFIDAQLARRMGWEIAQTPTMTVKMGDGYRTQIQGCCPRIEVCIAEAGYKFICSPHLFDLGGPDIVLGIEWLKTLGDTIVNWQTQHMSFWCDHKWVKLHGFRAENETCGALQGLLKSPWEKNQGELRGGDKHKSPVDKMGNLTNEQQRELNQLLRDSAQVFQEKLGLPPGRGREHQIPIMQGQGPVNVRPYRYPHMQKAEIEKQVREMLDSGIIRPSTSAYSSPVILVKKKDQTWRMCVDYRALNKVTIPDKFPIPVIEELLDELHGARYFSKLDLKSGYHQVRMKVEDIHKTAFRTHEGHYEYLVMPFGLMNAPSTFQSLMNDVFRPMLRKGVLVFFDDILVYSKDWDSHVVQLKQVLQQLEQQSLTANLKKCNFGQTSVEYLGHLISEAGVAVDPNKVSSVQQWPVPKNVKGVRGFLGLTEYYHKFIRDYGKIAKPLT
ncbi:uncharacterized protein LOC130736899 [Lotus japonicus]|uniref:uncharacterized protein LOC130736899 n=1 Tax=Lotus japonicus TaxID=34305 RepID=UPI0025841E95|nr:uncharacterized protein LOC130736899 [Lotus japonicus]